MVIKGINNNVTTGSISGRDGKIKNNGNFQEILTNKINLGSNQKDAISRSVKMNIIEESSHLLDILEDYANALSDTSREISEIEPLVSEIETQLEILRRTIPENIHSDGELEAIVNRITMEASLSVYKYKRGDYH